MKKIILLIPFFVLFAAGVKAQSCKFSLNDKGMTISEFLKWTEEPPLAVFCEKEKMILSSFEFTLFTRKPLQSKTFGVGDRGGIPIMAHEALKNEVRPGDTVILKSVTAIRPDGSEVKIDNISVVLN